MKAISKRIHKMPKIGIWALLITLLVACGQKGPLFLPPEVPEETKQKVEQELEKLDVDNKLPPTK